MRKQLLTIIITFAATAIVAGYATYLFTSAKNSTPATPASAQADESQKDTVKTPPPPQPNNLDPGLAVQKEIKNLLATKFGMRLTYREPMYNREPATSPDGTLVATINSYHTNRFIEVKDKKDNSLRQYVNTIDDGLTEELGDMHFSPDGKKIAYATYTFGRGNNDEQLNSANMGYAYIIDLETGKQTLLRVIKKHNVIVRITDWKENNPTIVEELLTEKNSPGNYPSLFIPYLQ